MLRLPQRRTQLALAGRRRGIATTKRTRRAAAEEESVTGGGLKVEGVVAVGENAGEDAVRKALLNKSFWENLMLGFDGLKYIGLVFGAPVAFGVVMGHFGNEYSFRRDPGVGRLFMLNMSDGLNSFARTGLSNEFCWGFTAGYFSGFGVKKLSKVLGLVIAAGFLTVNWMGYEGLIESTYKGLDDALHKLDSEFSTPEARKEQEDTVDEILRVVKYHVPSVTGFAAGVLLGLRTP